MSVRVGLISLMDGTRRKAKMRARLQLSIRGLLLSFAAGSVVMAFVGDRVRRAETQDDAVQRIESLGCIVQYNWQPKMADWHRVAELRLQPDVHHGSTTSSWISLLRRDLFQSVEAVAVRGALVEWYHDPAGREMLRGFEVPARAYDEIDSLIAALQRLRTLKYVYIDAWPRRGASHSLQKRLAEELPHCAVLRTRVSTVRAACTGMSSDAQRDSSGNTNGPGVKARRWGM